MKIDDPILTDYARIIACDIWGYVTDGMRSPQVGEPYFVMFNALKESAHMGLVSICCYNVAHGFKTRKLDLSDLTPLGNGARSTLSMISAFMDPWGHQLCAEKVALTPDDADLLVLRAICQPIVAQRPVKGFKPSKQFPRQYLTDMQLLVNRGSKGLSISRYTPPPTP